MLEGIICYSDSVLNDKSKNDMMALVSNAYETSKSTDAQLQDHIISQLLFFPANVPLEDKKQSDLVKQLEFRPSVDVYRLMDADNKLSDTVVIKHILSKNTLFLRMINQSVLYTCTEHQLKSEGLAFSKNVWAFPYMADFVIAKESSIKVLGAEKAVPIAVFVADVGSRQVGMSDLTRYSISQSKRYFSREGYMVITIQPENFKLRKNNQELIKDLIKSVESYTNFTN